MKKKDAKRKRPPADREVARKFLSDACVPIEGVMSDMVDDNDPGPTILGINTHKANEDGQRELIVAILDGDFLRDDNTKRLLAEVVIPTIAVANDLDCIAYSSSAWLLDPAALSEDELRRAKEANERGEQPSVRHITGGKYRQIADHPAKIEQTVMMFAARHTLYGLFTAQIIREDGKVRLGDWDESVTSENGASVSGIFGDAVKRAVEDDTLYRTLAPVISTPEGKAMIAKLITQVDGF